MRITTLTLLTVLMFVFCIHTLTSINQDIGRHITLGRIIVQTHHVPATNLFSYTAGDFPFINHHWFGEVLLYLGSVALGLKWLILVKAFIIVAAFSLALFAFYRPQTALASVLAGLIAIFIIIERTDVRPEIFSFLFLGWYLFVLFDKRRYDRWLIWTLPVAQLMWVNTHIYFFLGPAIFLSFIIGEIIRSRTENGWKIEKSKLFAGVLILLANLVNPAGWYGAVYPFVVLNNYGYSIVENQTLFFLRAFNYPPLTSYMFFAGMALMLASFAFNYQKIRRNIFSLCLAFIAIGMGLQMIRNFPVSALIIIPVTVKNFYQAGLLRSSVKSLAVSSIILISLIISVAQNQIYAQAHLGRTFGLKVPNGARAAVDFVRANNLKGPLFNNFDIGSFLIWKLPEEKVFIDGRPEAYPADFIQKIYIPMQEDPDIWEKYSAQYGINYIFWSYADITPWSQKFVNYITNNKKWALIYRDGTIIILVKNIPQNAGLIRKYRQAGIE